MPRRILALAAFFAAVAIGAWGCQQYNFNPVGSCVIQPGSHTVTLPDTTDILFVVDDSSSMDPKQQALANNFSQFINALTTFNVDRVAAGLKAFDFHIAVTTSSVFRNYELGSTSGASSTCQTIAGGGINCCAALSCTAGNSCQFTNLDMGTCTNLSGGGTACCVGPSVCDQGAAALGKSCGHYATAFESPLLTAFGCTQGVAAAGVPYPQGDFVAASGNPKVLHFANLFTNCTVPSPACTAGSACGAGKMCYAGTSANACCDDKTSTLNTLISQFQGNVLVGSCGSGEEQHLQAARLALGRAFSGQQPGVAAGEWPHAGSKIVVAIVADEDDCSNPADPSTAIVLSGLPGSDTCVSNTNPFGNLDEYLVDDFVSYFTNLGHPFGGAFIVSATCTGGTCNPSLCNGGSGLIGYSAGPRLLLVASGLAAAGSAPVEGSVCDPFGATLVKIAGLVVPHMTLPSLPASSDITILRITNSSGDTLRVCSQATTQAQADAHTYGWWFYSCSDASARPAVSSAPTTCIFIDNTNSNCQANQGETYSAEYLGQVPQGGCANASPTKASSNSCAQSFPVADGGPSDPNSWWCYGPLGGTGTCVCAGP